MSDVWTPDLVARLAALWAEGLSMLEIGRRLGVTKNAVVGKAHRENLVARPSPIREKGSGAAPRVVQRVRGPTLGPLASVAAAPVFKGHIATRPELMRAAFPARQPVPVAAPVAAVAAPLPRFAVRPAPCCWLIGDPKQKGFRFCEAEGVPGKPYCAAHQVEAWVRAPAEPAAGMHTANARRATWGGLTAAIFGQAAE